MHLLTNLVTMLFCSYSAEKEYRRKSLFLVMLILSGIGGNLMSATLSPYSIGVGASGCLYGVLGSLVAWVGLNWAVIGKHWQMWAPFAVLLVMGILFSFA